MRTGCIFPIMAIGLLAVGAPRLYVSLTNRTPSAMTYREFLEKKPSSGWIEISDARLDLISAIHENNRVTGNITKAYVPVESSSAGKRGGDHKIHLLLITEDESILTTLNDLEAATGGGGMVERLKRQREAQEKKKTGSETQAGDAGFGEALRFVLENHHQLSINRPVRGLLQFGLDSKSRDRDKIRALDADIAPDFAILEDGAQPDVTNSACMVVAGLALAMLVLARWLKAAQSTRRAPGSTAFGLASRRETPAPSKRSRPTLPDLEFDSTEVSTDLGGFWRRIAACFIDGIIVFFCWVIAGGALITSLAIWGGSTGNQEALKAAGGILSFLVELLITALYFVVMESSPAQATIGKRAMGLRVINGDGGRISFGQALGRFGAKFISALPCGTGFFIAGLTEKKQALHDMLAGTLVVRNR